MVCHFILNLNNVTLHALAYFVFMCVSILGLHTAEPDYAKTYDTDRI